MEMSLLDTSQIVEAEFVDDDFQSKSWQSERRQNRFYDSDGTKAESGDADDGCSFSDGNAEMQAYLLAQKQYGEAIIRKNDKVTLSEPNFACYLKHAVKACWLPSTGQFHLYSPDNGAWRAVSEVEMLREMKLRLSKYLCLLGLRDQLHLLKNGFLMAVMKHLKAEIMEAADFFDSKYHKRKVLGANGVVDFANPHEPALIPFDANFRFAAPGRFKFNPDAKCEIFMDTLRNSMDDDDIDVLLAYLGSCLIGGNPTQQMLCIEGKGNSSKSTIVNIAEKVIGPERFTELLTEKLKRPFEISAYVGKSVLVGKDVPGNFLQLSGASYLKKLTGNDSLTAEQKGLNDRVTILGNKAIMITSNSRMKVKISNDREAWARRLLYIRASAKVEYTPIPSFEDKILEDEGEGVFNLFIRSASKFLSYADTIGKIPLSDCQRAYVDGLFSESMSIDLFVERRLERNPQSQMTSEELYDAYLAYCSKAQWFAYDKLSFYNSIGGLISKRFSISQTHSIKRDGKSKRGFSGIDVKNDQAE